MKRIVASIVLVTLALMLGVVFAAQAEDGGKLVGVITKIEVAGQDAASATATLKDTATEQLVTVTVNDSLTLEKFKDHRIVEGDEIRCKYETVNGEHISKLFRKTAGC